MAGSDHGRSGGHEGNGSGRHREPASRARHEDARARPSTRARDEQPPRDDLGHHDEPERAAGGPGGASGYGAGNAAWGSSHEGWSGRDERDRAPRAHDRPPEQGEQQGRWWPGGWGGPGATGARADHDDDRVRSASSVERGHGPAWGYDRDQGRWVRDEPRRAGKPPKNYQRSDQRIFEELCELITRESDVDASDVEIHVAGGEITMKGYVRDRADKRELDALADRVLGVKDVHNQVRVRG
jgi:hypothetical protein